MNVSNALRDVWFAIEEIDVKDVWKVGLWLMVTAVTHVHQQLQH